MKIQRHVTDQADDGDIVRKAAQRSAASAKPKKARQAEHPDWRQPKHPIHDLQKTTTAGTEEADDMPSLRDFHMGHAEREKHAENNNSKNRPFSSSLEDIRGQQTANKLNQVRRYDLQVGHRGGGQK